MSDPTKTNDNTELVIGIDLGTTNSVVAIHHFGRSEVIANDSGARTTPSIVYLGPTNADNLVGAPAKQMSVNSPQCTVFGAKRMLGRRFNDPIIQDDIKLWPYTVTQHNGFPLIEITHDDTTRTYTPEEVSGFILGKMRKTAEDFLGCTITKAVITVPANFNSLQRNATKVAATHAGLTVPRILNEPTAAAFAYGYQSKERGKDKQHILIYDFGGGTLDVSIVVADNGIFQVLGTDGDTHLGGEDFDNVLVDYCLQQFEKQTGLDPRNNSRVLRKLRAECEKAKCSLSSLTKTFVEISFKGEEVVLEISRPLFEKIAKIPLERCIQPVKSLLDRLKLDDNAIDEIILVGGTTRIPKIQKNIINSFPKFRSEEKTLCKTVNADEVVAVGASLQAAVLSKSSFQATDGIQIIDVIPLSFGLKTISSQFLEILPRNTVLPASNSIEIGLDKLYTSKGQYLNLLEGEDDDINNSYLLDTVNISRILQTNTDPNLILKIKLDVDKHGNLSVSVLPLRNNNDTNGIYAYFDGSKLVYHKYGDKQATRDPNKKVNQSIQPNNQPSQSQNTTQSIDQNVSNQDLVNVVTASTSNGINDHFDEYDQLFGEMISFSNDTSLTHSTSRHNNGGGFSTPPQYNEDNDIDGLDISGEIPSNTFYPHKQTPMSPLGGDYQSSMLDASSANLVPPPHYGRASTTYTNQSKQSMNPVQQHQSQQTIIPTQESIIPTQQHQSQPILTSTPTATITPVPTATITPTPTATITPVPTPVVTTTPTSEPTTTTAPTKTTKTTIKFDDDDLDDLLDDFFDTQAPIQTTPYTLVPEQSTEPTHTSNFQASGAVNTGQESIVSGPKMSVNVQTITPTAAATTTTQAQPQPSAHIQVTPSQPHVPTTLPTKPVPNTLPTKPVVTSLPEKSTNLPQKSPSLPQKSSFSTNITPSGNTLPTKPTPTTTVNTNNGVSASFNVSTTDGNTRVSMNNDSTPLNQNVQPTLPTQPPPKIKPSSNVPTTTQPVQQQSQQSRLPVRGSIGQQYPTMTSTTVFKNDDDDVDTLDFLLDNIDISTPPVSKPAQTQQSNQYGGGNNAQGGQLAQSMVYTNSSSQPQQQQPHYQQQQQPSAQQYGTGQQHGYGTLQPGQYQQHQQYQQQQPQYQQQQYNTNNLAQSQIYPTYPSQPTQGQGQPHGYNAGLAQSAVYSNNQPAPQYNTLAQSHAVPQHQPAPQYNTLAQSHAVPQQYNTLAQSHAYHAPAPAYNPYQPPSQQQQPQQQVFNTTYQPPQQQQQQQHGSMSNLYPSQGQPGMQRTPSEEKAYQEKLAKKEEKARKAAKAAAKAGLPPPSQSFMAWQMQGTRK